MADKKDPDFWSVDTLKSAGKNLAIRGAQNAVGNLVFAAGGKAKQGYRKAASVRANRGAVLSRAQEMRGKVYTTVMNNGSKALDPLRAADAHAQQNLSRAREALGKTEARLAGERQRQKLASAAQQRAGRLRGIADDALRAREGVRKGVVNNLRRDGINQVQRLGSDTGRLSAGTRARVTKQIEFGNRLTNKASAASAKAAQLESAAQRVGASAGRAVEGLTARQKVLAGVAGDAKQAAIAARNQLQQGVNSLVNHANTRANAVYSRIAGEAPALSRGQEALLAVGDRVKKARDAVTGLGGRIGSAGSTAGKAMNPFASATEIAQRAAAGGKTEKAIVGAAKWSVKGVKVGAKVTAFPLTAAAKGTTGVFNTIEKTGNLVAGTGKAGKVLKLATSAKGNAAVFAVSAWVDAAQEYQKMKEAGVSFSDLGKKTYHTEKVADSKGNTRTVEVERQNPTLTDVVFSKEFGTGVVSKLDDQVLLGAGKAVTRGLTRFITGKTDEQLDEEERAERVRRNTYTDEDEIRDMMNAKTRDGKPAYTSDEIQARADKLQQIRKFQRSEEQYGDMLYQRNGQTINNENFRNVLATIDARYDQRILNAQELAAKGAGAILESEKGEKWRQYRSLIDQGKGDEVVKDYLDYVTRYQNQRREADVKYMLGHTTAAANIADENKRAAYRLFIGRDSYDDDMKSGTLSKEDSDNLKEFTKMWHGQSLEEQVRWSWDDQKRQMEEASASYAAPKPDGGQPAQAGAPAEGPAEKKEVA